MVDNIVHRVHDSMKYYEDQWETYTDNVETHHEESMDFYANEVNTWVDTLEQLYDDNSAVREENIRQARSKVAEKLTQRSDKVRETQAQIQGELEDAWQRAQDTAD